MANGKLFSKESSLLTFEWAPIAMLNLKFYGFLGRVYTKTCVIDASVMFNYNVCSKMIVLVSLVSNGTSFKCMPSFYYIHCSEMWHLCQWHKFRCKHGLRKTDFSAVFVLSHLHLKLSFHFLWQKMTSSHQTFKLKNISLNQQNIQN